MKKLFLWNFEQKNYTKKSCSTNEEVKENEERKRNEMGERERERE